MTTVGDIRVFGGTKCTIADWATCDGSLLSISEYPDLYALIGTTYGGDGTTTFALPDLAGKVAIHTGDGFSVGSSGTAAFGLSGLPETTTLIALVSSEITDAYIGEIRPFAFGFTPTGWHQCDGSTLNTYSYNMLYTLIGTTYGGNGTTTFAVPNFNVTATESSSTDGIGYVLMTFCICTTEGAMP